MINCKICDDIAVLPINFNCNDIFCFLCIKSHLNISNACPNCNNIINCDINKIHMSNLYLKPNLNRNIFWLYSSYRNKWWCYDDKTNDMIDSMYNNYIIGSTEDRYNENNIIKISKKKYRIDFNRFLQIDILNSKKQRKIKKIEFNKTENIMDNYNALDILGIAGVKF